RFVFVNGLDALSGAVHRNHERRGGDCCRFGGKRHACLVSQAPHGARNRLIEARIMKFFGRGGEICSENVLACIDVERRGLGHERVAKGIGGRGGLRKGGMREESRRNQRTQKRGKRNF